MNNLLPTGIFIIFVAVISCTSTVAFSVINNVHHTKIRHCAILPNSLHKLKSAVVEIPHEPSLASPSPSFGRRMRDLVLRRNSKRQQRQRQINNDDVGLTENEGVKNGRPRNVVVVNTLEEYKAVVADEKERMVVVRFYATWCKSCKAIGPSFYRLANRNPSISFVEVPVTQHNANLHQGLGVSSLPFGHIYHPKAGLLEELRISKKHFPKFEKILQSYVCGFCELLDGGCEINPYAPEREKEEIGIS